MEHLLLHWLLQHFLHLVLRCYWQEEHSNQPNCTQLQMEAWSQCVEVRSQETTIVHSDWMMLWWWCLAFYDGMFAVMARVVHCWFGKGAVMYRRRMWLEWWWHIFVFADVDIARSSSFVMNVNMLCVQNGCSVVHLLYHSWWLNGWEMREDPRSRKTGCVEVMEKATRGTTRDNLGLILASIVPFLEILSYEKR